MTLLLTDENARERVMALFGLFQVPDHLEDLTLPAGFSRGPAPRELLDAGFVRYRTETGIAFQEPDDWDIVLTVRGMRVLRDETNEELDRLA